MFRSVITILMIHAAGAAACQQVAIRSNATTASGVIARSDIVIAELEDEAFSAPLVSLSEAGDTVSHGRYTLNSYVWSASVPDDADRSDDLFELPLLITKTPEISHRSAGGIVRSVSLKPDSAASGRSLAVAVENPGSSNGRLLIFRADDEHLFFGSEPVEITYPGVLVDLTWFDFLDSWALLSESTTGLSVVFVDETPSLRQQHPVSFGIETMNSRYLVDAGGSVVVVGTGYDLRRADGPIVTWVAALGFDGSDSKDPISIPGNLVGSRDAVLRSQSGLFWVVTETSSVASATATLVEVGDELAIRSVITLPSATISFAATRSITGDSTIFACGSMLQKWSDFGQRLGSHRFDAAVTSLVWCDERLLVGEGNRVHRVAAESLIPERTVNIFSGHVAAMGGIPSPLVDLGDSDGDRVFDPIDPDTTVGTPAIEAPRRVWLRQEAAGNEVRAVGLELSFALRGYRYEVIRGGRGADGFRVYPLEGAMPGTLNLALDPGYVRQRSWDNRIARISVALFAAGESDPVDEVDIEIAVRPAPLVAHRMLLVSAGGTDDFASFASFLRAAPRYYSVSVKTNPDPESLSGYDVLLVSLDAVINGRIPRTYLERFAADGGGLLLFASSLLTQRVSDADEWLAPFRIRVRPLLESLGSFEGECAWCGVWTRAGLGEGILATVELPGEVLFGPGPASREGPLIRAPFGLGRLVFAGSDGLLNASETNFEIRNALLDAIHWLARTRAEVEDRDGDRLADVVEDRNGNGQVDSGETDPQNPDCDGDMLSDGHEDSNGNGRVDPGETDPLDPDTDRDRISDGADTVPYLQANTV